MQLMSGEATLHFEFLKGMHSHLVFYDSVKRVCSYKEMYSHPRNTEKVMI